MNRIGFIPVLLLALSLAGVPGTTAAVEVGDKAPNFDLPSTKGGNLKLSDLAGKKTVILQFYVLDFTPT
jgi:peroxiredoxin